MRTTAFILTMLVPAVVAAQPKPTTGTAPVNGLKMGVRRQKRYDN
jgi:hypothetical protein